MMQPWENGKNSNFGPNLVPQNFFSWVLPLLVVRHCSKLSSYAISTKTNEPNLTKWQKNLLILHPVLACLAQIWVPKIFWGVSPLQVVRHCSKLSPIQFKRKLMNQTWENSKRPNFEPNFGLFGPSLSLQKNFCGFNLY